MGREQNLNSLGRGKKTELSCMTGVNAIMEEKFEVERFLFLDEIPKIERFLFFEGVPKVENILIEHMCIVVEDVKK